MKNIVTIHFEINLLREHDEVCDQVELLDLAELAPIPILSLRDCRHCLSGQ